jgi:hypothetical protein
VIGIKFMSSCLAAPQSEGLKITRGLETAYDYIHGRYIPTALLRFPDRKLSVVDKTETNLVFIIVLWPKSGIYLKYSMPGSHICTQLSFVAVSHDCCSEMCTLCDILFLF